MFFYNKKNVEGAAVPHNNRMDEYIKEKQEQKRREEECTREKMRIHEEQARQYHGQLIHKEEQQRILDDKRREQEMRRSYNPEPFRMPTIETRTPEPRVAESHMPEPHTDFAEALRSMDGIGWWIQDTPRSAV